MNNCSNCPYGPYDGNSDFCDGCMSDPDTGFGGFTDHRIDVHFDSDKDQSEYYSKYGATKPDEGDGAPKYVYDKSVGRGKTIVGVVDDNYKGDITDLMGGSENLMAMLSKVMMNINLVEPQQPSHIIKLTEDDPAYYQKALVELIDKARKHGITTMVGKNPVTHGGVIQFSNIKAKAQVKVTNM